MVFLINATKPRSEPARPEPGAVVGDDTARCYHPTRHMFRERPLSWLFLLASIGWELVFSGEVRRTGSR